MDLGFVSVHNHAKKVLGQYAAILTSRLVNNPSIFLSSQLVTDDDPKSVSTGVKRSISPTNEETIALKKMKQDQLNSNEVSVQIGGLKGCTLLFQWGPPH